MASRTRRVQRTSEIWPGFVDALSTLLMVIIFLLVVYMLAQHFLTVTLSGRDEALDRLNRQVGELSELLSLEHKTTADLRLSLAEIKADLESVTATRDDLSARLATALTERDALDLRIVEATGEAATAQAGMTVAAWASAWSISAAWRVRAC